TGVEARFELQSETPRSCPRFPAVDGVVIDPSEKRLLYRTFFCARLRQSFTASATASGIPVSDQPIDTRTASTKLTNSDFRPVDIFLPRRYQAPTNDRIITCRAIKGFLPPFAPGPLFRRDRVALRP